MLEKPSFSAINSGDVLNNTQENPSPEDYRKKQIELAEVFFREEAEEEYGNIKKITNSQFYDILINALTKEKMKSALFAEDADSLAADLSEKLKNEKIDSNTGLERRAGLYRLLDEKIGAALCPEGRKDLSDNEWLDIFNHANIADSKNNNMRVMMSDMSYLSLVNSHGHAFGDELLAYTGKLFRDNNIKAFRHGGDEFTAFFEKDQESIQGDLETLNEKYQQKDDVANLKEYGLKPNIDTGLANFQEALAAFQELSKTDIGKQELAKTIPISEFKDLWVDIADLRVMIKKAQKRIPLLIELYRQDTSTEKQKYRKLNNFLGKGGYNISDSELDTIINTPIESRENTILAFIAKKENENISKINDPYKKERSKIIARTNGLDIA